MTVTVALAARDFAFDRASLSVRAGTGFRIAFTNADAGVQHSVAIRKPSGALAFRGATVMGASKTTYSVAALPAGAYTFFCTVHTFMTGSLSVH